MDFAVLADHRVKLKESKKNDKYRDLARELKKKTQKLWNMRMTVIPIVTVAVGTVTKGSVQGLEDLEINKRMSGNHPNYSIIEISQNTKKSPGDLRRLAVTQTPVRNHQLVLVWKTWKGVNNNNSISNNNNNNTEKKMKWLIT